MDNLVSESASTEQLAIYKELYQAIEQLPDKQKRALKLHYFKGKKYEQIAREMNTTPGTIKGWMNRAKKQLKEMLT